MQIEDQLVVSYLQSELKFDNHWVFQSIVRGKHLFELPDIKRQHDVKNLLSMIKSELNDFKPLNLPIYASLYPNWKQIIDEMHVLLVVGCPNPYDAMVREHDGHLYMIFDLIRLCDYADLGADIPAIIKQLITHESSHLCLHKKYPYPTSNTYIEQLKYIIFDEGFAHVLAFQDDISHFDFGSLIQTHYQTSLNQLKDALIENKEDKQKQFLLKSNSGPYWDKFAAISGKLFIASRIDDINDLYDQGVDNFIKEMGL